MNYSSERFRRAGSTPTRWKAPKPFAYTMPRHQERRELAEFLRNRKRHQSVRIDLFMARLTAREIRAALDQVPAEMFSSRGEDHEDRFEHALCRALLDKGVAPFDVLEASAPAAKPEYFQTQTLRGIEDLF